MMAALKIRSNLTRRQKLDSPTPWKSRLLAPRKPKYGIRHRKLRSFSLPDKRSNGVWKQKWVSIPKSPSELEIHLK